MTSEYLACVVNLLRYCQADEYDTQTPAWFKTIIAYSYQEVRYNGLSIVVNLQMSLPVCWLILPAA